MCRKWLTMFYLLDCSGASTVVPSTGLPNLPQAPCLDFPESTTHTVCSSIERGRHRTMPADPARCHATSTGAWIAARRSGHIGRTAVQALRRSLALCSQTQGGAPVFKWRQVALGSHLLVGYQSRVQVTMPKRCMRRQRGTKAAQGASQGARRSSTSPTGAGHTWLGLTLQGAPLARYECCWQSSQPPVCGLAVTPYSQRASALTW